MCNMGTDWCITPAEPGDPPSERWTHADAVAACQKHVATSQKRVDKLNRERGPKARQAIPCRWYDFTGGLTT